MIRWSEFRSLFAGALRLDAAPFEHMRDASDGVGRGLVFLVAIGLFAGLIPAVVSFAQTAATTPREEMAEVERAMDQVFEQMERFGAFDADPEAGDMVRRNITAGMELGLRIADEVVSSTPAPYAAVTLLEAVAGWISGVFSWIGLWLLWGVLALIGARAFGGSATIQQMLAATSLVAAPHVLGALSFVPCAGAMIQLIAVVWGLAVYVKAVAVTNRIDGVRATIAVFLPVALAIAAAFAFFFGLVLLIAASN